MRCALVLTAAGSSTRMGGAEKKEYLTISSNDGLRVSVLSSALFAFLATNLISSVVITVPAGGSDKARAVLFEDERVVNALSGGQITLSFAEGGSSRQESVRHGLAALAEQTGGALPDIVLIHDGARPWVSEKLIHDVIVTTEQFGAGIPGVTPTDTLKEMSENGTISRHLDRSRLVAVQTPQGFRFGEIRAAHEKARDDGRTYTDDAEIWGQYVGTVRVCEGDFNNRKVTYPGDLR